MSALHPHFEEAVGAIHHGDNAKLNELLKAHPALVKEKHTATDGLYAGYFHGATLLHHVAFNPFPAHEMPVNIVEIAAVLLEAGADPNAICGGGPSQPDTAHGTVIGLVVSGSQGINKGLAEPLVKVLVKSGAALEYGSAGIHMFGALYHTVENQRQREAAMILYDMGHDIDMVFAAGLGILFALKGYVGEDGVLKGDADRFFKHYRKDDLKPASTQEILQDCLLAASVNNQMEVIDFLLTHFDLDINAWRGWGPFQVTALHGACWSGWLEIAQYLVKKGANTMLHDPEHNTTPIGWAHYSGHQELFDWFMTQDELINLFDAAEFGKAERFKTLLGDQDPDMPIGDGEGGVLLRMAAHDDNLPIARALLEKGADPNLKNSQGKSALDWAREKEHQAMVELLMSFHPS